MVHMMWQWNTVMVLYTIAMKAFFGFKESVAGVTNKFNLYIENINVMYMWYHLLIE